ncbi:MAG: hypothetical protein KKE05_03020 [Nanoarchaeota archaeon]|nr:hypothetical protein [Nanoarchaeota archaeon]
MAWNAYSEGTKYDNRGCPERSSASHRAVGIPKAPKALSKPRTITAVDFVGGKHNAKAVVHYSDGTQEVYREFESGPPMGEYQRLKEMFPVP